MFCALTSVQSNTVSTSGAVHFNSTSIRLEALARILGSDTALDGETAD